MERNKTQLRVEAAKRLRNTAQWLTCTYDAIAGGKKNGIGQQMLRDIDILTDGVLRVLPEDEPMKEMVRRESGEDGRMGCEYCDGESNPKITGTPYLAKLLFCIRGGVLIMRALEKSWLYPQWLLNINYCPMCGRKLRSG